MTYLRHIRSDKGLKYRFVPLRMEDRLNDVSSQGFMIEIKNLK